MSGKKHSPVEIRNFYISPGLIAGNNEEIDAIKGVLKDGCGARVITPVSPYARREDMDEVINLRKVIHINLVNGLTFAPTGWDLISYYYPHDPFLN